MGPPLPGGWCTDETRWTPPPLVLWEDEPVDEGEVGEWGRGETGAASSLFFFLKKFICLSLCLVVSECEEQGSEGKKVYERGDRKGEKIEERKEKNETERQGSEGRGRE